MKKLSILLLILITPLLSIVAQEKIITGTVISSEDNLPLIGATVVVKGTTTGTITNFDGKYSINVPEDAQVLQFSFVGLLTKEIEIGDQTEINVVLDPDILEMEEVVVTAIGIKREKKALGYAVQDVESEQISRSNNDNIVNSLSGKIAGVHINSSSGAAGSSTFIEIRGAASITRSNRPLFVIDGIPIDGGGGGYGTDGVATSDRVGDLNPDDIENVSVLKGGAASALYGMRAANGVVIITTKKGSEAKDGQVHVNVHSSVTFDKVSQLPELQDKFVQGSRYYADDFFVDLFGQIYNRINSPDGPKNWRDVSWGPHVDSLTYTTDPDFIPFDAKIFAYSNGGEYDSMSVYMKKWDPNGRIVYNPDYEGIEPSEYFGYDPSLSGGKIKTYDPYDFFQTGITLTNSVNISGGNEKTNYYLSYANTKVDGVIPNNTYTKNNFKLSAQSEIMKNLTSSASVNYMQNSGNRIQQGSNLSGLMIALSRTPINFDNAYAYEFEDGTQRHYQGNKPSSYDNPYWVTNNILFKDYTNRMVGSLELKYSPFAWMDLTYRMGSDWYHREITDYFEKNSNAFPQGKASKGHTFSKDLNTDLILSINKTFNEAYNITFLVGQNFYHTDWKTLSGFSTPLQIREWNNIANSNDINAAEASGKKRSLATYSDLGLSYKSLLFTNVTVRQETSSTLPTGENTFIYPSFSLGFIFTELPGISDNDLLPYGKIRTSYGITALTAREYSTYTRSYVAGAGDGWTNGVFFPFKNTAGFSIGTEIGNSILKPEKQKTFEIGTELKFINNLFRVDLAYYINKNEDLLISAPISGSTGHSYKYMNIGNMETKGIELSLGVSVVKSSNMNWDILVNFDNPNTVVTYLANNTENINIGGFEDPQVHAVLNQPYRMIWGTRWLRDENDNLIINDDPSKGKVGHPVQDIESGIIGQYQPDYKMGITNTISIKGLTINALIDIKKGGQLWNGTKGALYYFGKHKDTETRNSKSEIIEGRMGHLNDLGQIVHYEGGINPVEVAGPGEFNKTRINYDETWYLDGPGSAFTGPVEDFMENADWFRLRELSVSYNFNSLLKNTFLKNLEIYFTGKNLILITPYTGVDPETSLFGNSNAQGIDYFNMPGTKSYSFGVKIGF